MSCQHSAVCFRFPFSVSVVPLASESIVLEDGLKAGFELECCHFYHLPVWPPPPEVGVRAVEGVIAQLCCPRARSKKTQRTHNPLRLFLPSSQNVCSLLVQFLKIKVYFLFCSKQAVQRAVLRLIWTCCCTWRVWMSPGRGRCVLEETSWCKWIQAPRFLFGDLTDRFLF